ncbi:MAG: hypothetical protein Q9187_006335, partial [Circinaria calcarea]
MEMTAITHPSTSMSIQSIIAPNTNLDFSTPSNTTWDNRSFMGIAPGPHDLMNPLYPRDDDTSSDGSTYSPASDGLQNRIQPQVFLPQYCHTDPRSNAHPEDFSIHAHPAVPLSTSNYPDWSDCDISQPFNGLDIGLERQFSASVGNPPFVYIAQEPSVDTLTDARPRNTLPFMERDGRTSLRSGYTNAPIMVSGQGRMVDMDDETLQHYYECYMTSFHSIFPILHHSTLRSMSPPPLLNAMILAIGTQFSPRPVSKWHSILLFEAASKPLANLVPT